MPVQQLPTEFDKIQFEAFYPDCPAHLLFEYWIQPELLAKWWVKDASVAPQLGGAYQFYWQKINVTLRGIYTVFEPGKRLAFTWHFDHEAHLPERLVNIHFKEMDGGTRLLLTHGTYTPIDTDERQGHIDGWLYFLDALYQQVEYITIENL